MRLKKFKRGDTFVEVCFALAIFSFLAVLAIGSMNRNLSTVQSTLEGEVSRSEIDAQTEAIRFIHETYVGGLNTGRGGNLAKAWSTITSKAISSNEAKAINQNWPPSNCQAYITQYQKHMMIVNTRNLDSDSNDIIIDGRNITSTSVIPRLTYAGKENESLSSSDNLTLDKAQGIWFYAVKGNDNKNDFYDIYIQSCWDSMDSTTPRTIDTVIRLYDPSYVDNIASTKKADYEIHFNPNGGHFPAGVAVNSEGEYVVNWPGATEGFAPPTDKVPDPVWDSHKIVGWSKTRNNANPSLNPKYSLSDAKCNKGKCVITVYAVWVPEYKIHYQNSSMVAGTVYNMPTPNPTDWQRSNVFKTGIPTIAASDGNCYKFAGWSRSPDGSNPEFSADNITLDPSRDALVDATNLYASWTKTTCGAFKIQLTWGNTPRDLDAHFSVNANGITSHTYYGDKNTILASGAGTVKVILDRDITDGSGRPETSTVTVNNLSGFSAVYYVHNYTGRSGGSPYLTSSGAVVKLTEEDSEGHVVRNYEYRCPTTGTGTYWNVFKIVNRQVIETNTITTKEPSA